MENIKKGIIILVLLMILAGCRSFDDALPWTSDRFDIADSKFDSVEDKITIDSKLQQRFELKLDRASISDVAVFLREKSEYQLMTDQNDLVISGNFEGTASKIVFDIAVLYNLKLHKINNTFYLVDDERFFNVTTVYNTLLSDEQISKLFDGKYLRYGNKIIFSGNLVDAVNLDNVLHAAKSEMLSNYVVSIVQVETTAELASLIQLEVGSKGLDLIRPGVTAYDVFSAVARVNGQYLDHDAYHERQFYVCDGQDFVYNNTTDKKIEQRAISDAGTSTISGYADVQAGAIVDFTVQGLIEDFVLTDFDIELSNFVGASLDKRVVKIKSESVRMRLGRVYYLASSHDKIDSKSFNVLGLGLEKNNLVTSIYVKIEKVD